MDLYLCSFADDRWVDYRVWSRSEERAPRALTLDRQAGSSSIKMEGKGRTGWRRENEEREVRDDSERERGAGYWIRLAHPAAVLKLFVVCFPIAFYTDWDWLERVCGIFCVGKEYLVASRVAEEEACGLDGLLLVMMMKLVCLHFRRLEKDQWSDEKFGLQHLMMAAEEQVSHSRMCEEGEEEGCCQKAREFIAR